jgi:hypothetical protein
MAYRSGADPRSNRDCTVDSSTKCSWDGLLEICVPGHGYRLSGYASSAAGDPVSRSVTMNRCPADKTRVGVMLAAPPEQAGVVGAILQTSMQTSAVVAISIQAGLLTVEPGGVHNYVNVQASWYFELGWVLVWLIGFLALYRPSKNLVESDGLDQVA